MNMHPFYVRTGADFTKAELAAQEAAPAVDPASANHPFTLAELGNAVKAITPTLIIGGVVAGFAFALGSGLVSRYVFKEGR